MTLGFEGISRDRREPPMWSVRLWRSVRFDVSLKSRVELLEPVSPWREVATASDPFAPGEGFEADTPCGCMRLWRQRSAMPDAGVSRAARKSVIGALVAFKNSCCPGVLA